MGAVTSATALFLKSMAMIGPVHRDTAAGAALASPFCEGRAAKQVAQAPTAGGIRGNEAKLFFPSFCLREPERFEYLFLVLLELGSMIPSHQGKFLALG
jgi:hypothetical protein